MNTFTLWPHLPSVKENALSHIRELDSKKCWTVTIEAYKAPKSDEQRGWFHVLCSMLGRELGYTLEDIKDYAKCEYFGIHEVTIGNTTYTRADGHSEKLSSKQYAELIEIVYRLGAQAGVTLPEADRERTSRAVPTGRHA